MAPLKKTSTINRNTPTDEIAQIFAALMASLAEKHQEIDQKIESVDSKHDKKYQDLLNFEDDLNGKIKKHHEMILKIPTDERTDSYTPVKNVDYFDGYTPVKNKDYFDGYTPVKNVDYFDGEKGDNGSADSPEDVRDKLESLDEENCLPIFAIKGLKKELDRLSHYFKDTSWLPTYYGGVNALRVWNNGVQTSDAGVHDINFVGFTVTNDQGNVTITSSGSGGFANQVALTGTAVTWNIPAGSPTPTGIFMLFIQGQYQNPTSYSRTGKVVTTAQDWTGAEVLAVY